MVCRAVPGWATMRPRTNRKTFLNKPMLHVLSTEQSPDQMMIEARSNLSLSLEELTAVFGGICVVTLLVVAWPVFMGLWPILLAALLHLALVGWCLRAAWRGNWARERLRLEGDDLVVEQFRLGRQERSTWPIAWTRIQLVPGRLRKQRLFVCFQGRKLELGSFLPVNEREELAGALHHMLSQGSAVTGLQTIRIS